jgi:hypothetical protein
MAQYESGSRTPKTKMIADLAGVLEVCPQALTVPDIDSWIGLAHTLFALEDMYGLRIGEIDGEVCLRLDKEHYHFSSMFDIFSKWNEEAEKLKNGEITEDDYDRWRYTYPLVETERTRAAMDRLRAERESADPAE